MANLFIFFQGTTRTHILMFVYVLQELITRNKYIKENNVNKKQIQ